jgi:23S rRNA (adenine2030-N6)-methyltransferase
LTVRARVDEFLASVRALDPPPTLAAELAIAGGDSRIKLKGCGLLVVNPPWQFADEARSILDCLGEILAREAGAGGRLEWVVREQAV